MFNFQQSYELGDYQLPFFLSPKVDNVHHNIISPATGGEKLKTPLKNKEKNKVGKNNENILKKITHSKIERQRRQEMANLYASLRSLLPLEYIKGKRSTSDHMHEAVNYINNLQKTISQLRLKKEMLTKSSPSLSTTSSVNFSDESRSDRSQSSTIKLNLYRNGVEILIRFNSKEEVVPVSRVLNKLLVQGFNVMSYLSTRSDDESILYRIESEVDDPSCIDTIGLQKTLMDTIMQDPTSQ